jgi:lipopolysaccharide/colanic/teichoic acid biosynthesis glycosyltransferase
MGKKNMTISEPVEAFPYKPPSKLIKTRYSYIFEINKPLPPRLLKNLFDKIVGLALVLLSIPVLFFLKIGFVIEGFLIPENKGSMLFYYNAVSAGKIIPKYKIRLIKTKFIDPVGAKQHDWIAFSAEWSPQSRTYMGRFIKNFYLDELPQFFSVVKGDISIVGPRTLSVLHYERDLDQGNVSRKLIKGGLLGLGHINKGTANMGDPSYEYEYIDHYIHRSTLSLFVLDLWIIWKGIKLISKGGGH